jgi:hypothetical protein
MDQRDVDAMRPVGCAALYRVLVLAFFSPAVLAQVGISGVIASGSVMTNDPTTGVLPTYNDVYANWTKAGLQTVGGIPSRSTVCATVTPLGGTNDDTAQINSAIASCPAGDVLMLSSGTYRVSEAGYINVNKGITLRGTGACNNASSPYCPTVIDVYNGATIGINVCSGGDCRYNPAILVGPTKFTGTWNTPTTLTADAAQGATSVTVASRSGFSVGLWVLIDEASGAGWLTDPLVNVTGSTYPSGEQLWAAPDWTSSSGSPATGRVAWQLHNPSVKGDDFSSVTYPSTPRSSGCYYSFCDRPTSELHKIKVINGNTITFDSPLTIAFRQSGGHNAQLYSPATPFVTNAGVENLTVEYSDQGGVVFEFCAYCWSKGVEVTTWVNGGINMAYTARTELLGNFTWKAAFPIPGGAEYAIDIQFASTEILVDNNISLQAGKAITVRSAGGGSVVAYNYMDEIMIGNDPPWQEMGASAAHGAGSHMVLFEGNWSHNCDGDSTHGSTVYHTYFRNLCSGYRTAFIDYFPGYVETIDDIDNIPGGNGPLRAAGAQYYNYWWAFVGNVLGTSGKSTAANGWVLNSVYPINNAGIWHLGWRDPYPQAVDPNVATYTFQHGNYDYYSNAVAWNPGYSNHTLPNSFYLPAEPSFFTAGRGYTWPWVNPTGSPQFYANCAGGSHTCLPAKARYEAGTPFVQP